MLTPFLEKKHTFFFNLIDADGNGVWEPADWALIGQRFAHAWKLDEIALEKVLDLAKGVWSEISSHVDHKSASISQSDWFDFVANKLINGDANWYDKYINGIVDGIFSIIDENQNGTIDWREYILFLSCLNISVGNARIAFDKLDLNGDGIIDSSELQACITEFLSSENPESPGNWSFGPIE